MAIHHEHEQMVTDAVSSALGGIEQRAKCLTGSGVRQTTLRILSTPTLGGGEDAWLPSGWHVHGRGFSGALGYRSLSLCKRLGG